jgi:hypothetical protein
MLFPFKNMKVQNTSTPPYMGGQTFLMVNTKAPHLDKIPAIPNSRIIRGLAGNGE